MQSRSKYRHIGVLILLFFAAGSFVSPDRLVVCMRDGHEARVVPVHVVHLACAGLSTKHCDGAGGSDVEISHQHVPCSDVPLSSPGEIGDRVPLPGAGRAWAGSPPKDTTGIASLRPPEHSHMAFSMAGYFRSAVSQHIQSVVLII